MVSIGCCPPVGVIRVCTAAMSRGRRRWYCLVVLMISSALIWFGSSTFLWRDTSPTWPVLATKDQTDWEPHQLMDRYERRARSMATNLTSTGTFKKILFWNEAYGSKRYGIGFGRDAFKKAGCPVWQCETSQDRSSTNVQDFDAILFHLRSWNAADLPKKRSAHQRYVFWSIESPSYRMTDTDLMKNFFNWTMSYRWDSDIVQAYGWIEPNNSLPLHPNTTTVQHMVNEARSGGVNYAAGKSRMAAWFVSNCYTPSARKSFVKRLKKYINVDVYGQCGTLTCPRTHEDSCRRMVEKKYKFYLSLENSLCRDYVTEKYFAMMHRNVVPIVLSLQGSHDRFSPPHSFINAMDFKSVRKLADYLKELDLNDTKYNEYFWWKPHYAVRNAEWDFNRGMCQLCAALHQDLPAKTYDDLTAWWDRNSTCGTLKFS